MYKLSMIDTDGLKFYREDGKVPTEHEIGTLIKMINDNLPRPMLIENDGNYDGVVIVKTKNYITKSGNKVDIKGSGLKATMKEVALKDFLAFTLNAIIDDKDSEISEYYNDLVKQIRSNDLNIEMWSKKITVTKSVLNPKRTNEERILAALSGEHYQEGDRYRIFFEEEKKLCLAKNYKGIYDKDKLYEKLFKTVKILEPVLDMSQFPNYKLKKNKAALELL